MEGISEMELDPGGWNLFEVAELKVYTEARAHILQEM